MHICDQLDQFSLVNEHNELNELSDVEATLAEHTEFCTTPNVFTFDKTPTVFDAQTPDLIEVIDHSCVGSNVDSPTNGLLSVRGTPRGNEKRLPSGNNISNISTARRGVKVQNKLKTPKKNRAPVEVCYQN